MFVTGNNIYGVGHQIASLVVAQDAGNKTQSFRQIRALEGGNTLHHVCVVLFLSSDVTRCVSLRGLCAMVLSSPLKGVPLLPLYSRGAGLHDGVLVGYGIGVLVGYNCTSCVQGRSDSIPIPIEAS